MSEFLKEARARGLIYQCTDEEGLGQHLKNGPITAYCGFDATATSLQVGNVVALMYLRLLRKHGHNVIALIGGATTKIGDPSGKDESRPAMDDATLAKHIEGITPAFKQFLTLKHESATTPVFQQLNNADWLEKLNYVDFVRHIGRLFSVNRMLSFDSVKTRLEREQPLSFLEFNYMIFQGYDFLHLFENYACTLQLGGSDQWGNIINGVELARKKCGQTLYGLTAPLITTSNGQKMGKTATGAVWLGADRTSPYDYWQFWRNTHDGDVLRYLRIFTDLPLEEIARFEHAKGSDLNDVKVLLANEATTLAHGSACLAKIHDAVSQLFAGGTGNAGSIPDVIVEVPSEGISILDACVQAGLCLSKGEARRLIKGGGLRLNDRQVAEESHLPLDAFPLKLSSGKKRHIRVITST